VLVPVVEGGPGDLEQLARLGDVALPHLLRLDETGTRSPGLLAKKATARFRMSRSSRASRSSLRNWAISARSAVVNPSERTPSSRSACRTHSRTAGRAHLPGYATGGAAGLADQRDNLGLELRGERPTRAPLLACHGLHFGHPFGGSGSRMSVKTGHAQSGSLRSTIGSPEPTP
jgi:hypothetical protein